MSKARIAPTANAGAQSSIPPPAGRFQAKCRFFAAGNCRKGTQCPFVHPPPKGCQSEPKVGRQNSNPEPSSSTRVHLSTESRASPERKEPNKSNDRRTSPRKGPKPQGKTNNRFPKKEEVAPPNNPAKQRNPQPDSTSVERPPTTGPSEGKKRPQASDKPYLQSIKAGNCTWGEACWYTYELAAMRDSESGKENASLATGKGSQQLDVNAKAHTNKAQGPKKPCFAWAKGSCKQGDGCPYQHGGKGKAPQAKPAGNGKKKRKPPVTHTYIPHVREVTPAARPLSKEDATFLRAYEEADQKAQMWALRHEWGFR